MTFDTLYINDKAEKMTKTYKSDDIQKIDNVFMITHSQIDDPGYISMAIFFRYCNLRCPTCCNSVSLSEHTGVIPFCLDDINEWASVVDSVTLVGGEPLIQDYDNIRNILQRAKDLGLRINIETNGLRLFDDDIKELWPLIDHVFIHITPEFMALGLYDSLDDLTMDFDTNVIWHPHNADFIFNAFGLLPSDGFHIKQDFMFGGEKYTPTKI
jgi:organic radical activating enzyme